MLSAQLKARVFRDHCYSGSSQNLYSYSYKKNQLSVGNDKISSIVVYPGWAVDLYEHDNYQGDCYTVTCNMNDLKSVSFGDKVSSLKIRSINYPSVNANNEEILPNQFVNSTKLTKTLDHPMYLNKNLNAYLKQSTRLHSQGIGWDEITGNFVYTACRANSSGSCVGESHLVLFNSSLFFAIDGVISQKYNGSFRQKSHPSAIQITNGKFPVAIARGKYETSYFEFYQVNQNSLSLLNNGNGFSYYKHIGAVAYANINGNTYIVGGGWDSDFLVVWRANGINQTSGFTYQKTIYPNSWTIQKCGVDQNWGAYNSLWLGKMKNGRIVLMASHGKAGLPSSSGWVDLWEINSLDKFVPTKMTKIHKSKTTNGSKRSHFYEGTTFGPSNRVYSAPHDFGFLFGDWMSAQAVYAHRYTYRFCTYGSGPNSYLAENQDAFTPLANLEDQEENLIELPLHKDKTNIHKEEIKYFPNPFRDIVNINISSFKNEPINGYLSITNLTGKIVRKIRLSDLVFQSKHLSLDLSDLEDGVYFFTVQTQQYFSTQKLIKFKR